MADVSSTIDRRVARTRATLQTALMSLIQEKDYEAVTVQDICEAANVGRSTFYAHYTSKDDLKRSGLEHLRKQLLERQREALASAGDSGTRPFGFSLTMFEHARDHLHHYRALVGSRGGAMTLGMIRQILADLIRDELAATSAKAVDLPHELVVQYVVGAYMAVLTWWLDGGAKLAPEQIDAMFRSLATRGVVPAAG